MPAADQIAGARDRAEAGAVGLRAPPRSSRLRTRRRLRRTRERAGRPAQPSLDELIARLSALHPKRIDLGARAHAAAAGAARSSRTQAAAGDPCRRHQRQGLDGRLSCARSWKRPGLRVHVYTSPCLVRINECFRLAGDAGRRRRTARRVAAHVERVNAGEPITVFEIETAAAFLSVRETSGRCAAAGSRSRRPARLHQCGRAAARLRDHAHRHGPHRISRRHADAIAGEKAAIIKRGVPVISAEQHAGGDGGDRGAGAAHARAAACRRPAMARQRRARPAGLSG